MTTTNRSSEDMKTRDMESIWHAMRPYSNNPSLIVTEGSGAWIKDIDGNEYLDGMSGLWCVNVGYGRKEIAEKAYEQMLKMPFYPLTQSHTPAIELSEKLNEWLGEDYIYFFSNSGSEANETAFKIARQYFHQNGEPGRYKFISRYRSYHGSSMATLAAGGQTQRKYKYEPLGEGFIHVTPPDSYRKPEGQSLEEYNRACAEEIDKVITWEAEETVAAVIMEPLITGGGILMPDETYMKRVKEICEKHGALLISDEVICGFGRTGKPFGFMNYDVQPDMITMAKGITSGYMPLSVTAVRKDIYEAFKGSDANDHFRHVNTFGGHPAACAAAVENMNIIEKEGLVERAADMGRKLRMALEDLTELEYVGDVRGKGLLVGIELVKDKSTKEALEESHLKKILAACKQNGLLVGKTSDIVQGQNNILTMAPPFTITEEDLEFIIATFKKNVKEQLSNVKNP
ncbi:aspartate aminotransferase family protein [Salibacterium aidingense]|uniref:aspartate aminotransferase family protein n=1 Tax=Salibacterium aidingense TaxID=384933 RepID=UPI003BCE8E31